MDIELFVAIVIFVISVVLCWKICHMGLPLPLTVPREKFDKHEKLILKSDEPQSTMVEPRV